MKSKIPKFLNKYREREGAMKSLDYFQGTGLFTGVPSPTSGTLKIIGSEGCQEAVSKWDHVSVSRKDRCPTWEEMCYVKSLFFKVDEWAMQLHPPIEDNINQHEFCLHLWRPLDSEIPKPPRSFV